MGGGGIWLIVNNDFMVECSLFLHCHLGGLRVVVALFVTRRCIHVMKRRQRIADRDSAARHCDGV